MKVDPFPDSHIIPENSSMSANKQKVTDTWEKRDGESSTHRYRIFTEYSEMILP